MSCDSRQPDQDWIYTDLLDNLDWICQISGRKKPAKQKSCCSPNIYNIFINNKKDPSGVLPSDISNITGLNTSLKKSNSNNSTSMSKDAYMRSIRSMYLDHSVEVVSTEPVVNHDEDDPPKNYDDEKHRDDLQRPSIFNEHKKHDDQLLQPEKNIGSGDDNVKSKMVKLLSQAVDKFLTDREKKLH